MGRPPKAPHAIMDIRDAGALDSFIDQIRNEALRVIEGMADPTKLQAVVDAIYKAATGGTKTIKQVAQCPTCKGTVEVSVTFATPGDVKAQTLWMERVAGKVPHTMIMRDPAREGYIQLLKEIRDKTVDTPKLPAPVGDKVIDAEFRASDTVPEGLPAMAENSPRDSQEPGRDS